MAEVLTNFNSHKTLLAHLSQIPTELLKSNKISNSDIFANPKVLPKVCSDIDFYVPEAVETVNLEQSKLFTLAQKMSASSKEIFANSSSSPSNNTTATNTVSDPYAILDNLGGDSSINLMALLLLLVLQYLLPEQLKIADEELKVTREISKSTAAAVNTNAVGQITNLKDAFDKAMTGANTSVIASYIAFGLAGFQGVTGLAGALKENSNVEVTKLENSFHDMDIVSTNSKVLNSDAEGIIKEDGLATLPAKITQSRTKAQENVKENKITNENIGRKKEALRKDLKLLLEKSKVEYKDIHTVRKALDTENIGFRKFNSSSSSVEKFNLEVENMKKFPKAVDMDKLYNDDTTISKFEDAKDGSFSVIKKLTSPNKDEIVFLSCSKDFAKTGVVNVFSVGSGRQIIQTASFDVPTANRDYFGKNINAQWENGAYLVKHGDDVKAILNASCDRDQTEALAFKQKLFTNAHEAETLRLKADSENKVAQKIKEFTQEIGDNYPIAHHMHSKFKNLTKRYEQDNMHQARLWHLTSTVSQSLSQAVSGYAQGQAAIANANADLFRGLAQILSNVSSFNQQTNQQLIDTLTRNISDIINSVFGFVQSVYLTAKAVTGVR